MGPALLLGSGFAFACALQPGPFQAFLLARAMSSGWRRTLPAAFAPLLSDAPIAILTLLLLRTLPAAAQLGLRAAGGLLLLWLGYRILGGAQEEAAGSEPNPMRTLGEGMLVNFLNPNPWLGWMLVLGPATLQAWRTAPMEAVVLLGSFYALMLLTQMLLIGVAAQAGRLSQGAQKRLSGLSGLLLLALGTLQLVLAARTLF